MSLLFKATEFVFDEKNLILDREYNIEMILGPDLEKFVIYRYFHFENEIHTDIIKLVKWEDYLKEQEKKKKVKKILKQLTITISILVGHVISLPPVGIATENDPISINISNQEKKKEKKYYISDRGILTNEKKIKTILLTLKRYQNDEKKSEVLINRLKRTNYDFKGHALAIDVYRKLETKNIKNFITDFTSLNYINNLRSSKDTLPVSENFNIFTGLRFKINGYDLKPRKKNQPFLKPNLYHNLSAWHFEHLSTESISVLKEVTHYYLEKNLKLKVIDEVTFKNSNRTIENVTKLSRYFGENPEVEKLEQKLRSSVKFELQEELPSEFFQRMLLLGFVFERKRFWQESDGPIIKPWNYVTTRIQTEEEWNKRN